ncbi:glycosyltransferase involved in cell wall biosynthesis [Roseiarcus fermentans]|uniref:Glycosyltransferase involved in cell wall biosynthesis n=1 Tax=Roseiarcus fermentans TaxID=1473586 RepID=A0A366EXK8_9HYPH|nr:GT4 family glycosyltransferase PelF [Roseiarcus fermentans]RBP07133.1 glycosyltransferase involved in cell wall biosynthesis [Roseiarcus fermentans]
MTARAGSSRGGSAPGPAADICLIVEGGYPYVVGGVAAWADALIRASPQLSFHVISITISNQPRRRSYKLPDNALGVTDVILDACPRGRAPWPREGERIRDILGLAEIALSHDDGSAFEALIAELRVTGFGQAALLDSKAGWRAMEQAYHRLSPNCSLLDFFWSWRFLVRSLLAMTSAPLPRARVFHAVATGYSGVLGSYARLVTKTPLLVTEHGIYTNERRIELAVADWLFESGGGGFDVAVEPAELRSIWLNAFQSFSRIGYAAADVITTQYRANQSFQRADGAPSEKLRIIPNGIDVAKLAAIPRSDAPRRPTVVMIGRIVPIKDVRTFIMAVALLKDLVPDVLAILIGPEDEDPEYAAECRQLVRQLGAEQAIEFLGRVPDVMKYLASSDVLALSSISEAQPIAVLEAAAIGLAIVTTDVGSCREIIEGFSGDPVAGRGGYVVEPCNPKAMAEALAKILLDGAMRRQMADVMRRRVGSYYHKDRVTRLYESLWAELMSPARPIVAGGVLEKRQ